MLETLLFDPYTLQQIHRVDSGEHEINMRRSNKLLVASLKVGTAGKGDRGTCPAGGEKFQQMQ